MNVAIISQINPISLCIYCIYIIYLNALVNAFKGRAAGSNRVRSEPCNARCHDAAARLVRFRLAARRKGARLVKMSDDEWEELNVLVRRVNRCTDTVAHRGPLSTKYARISRSLKLARQHRHQVSLRVRRLVERYNGRHAKTEEELINLDERKRPIQQGRGAYKRWLPAALLRVCWGLRPERRPRKKRLPATRLRSKSSLSAASQKRAPAAVAVASLRETARQHQSSTTHVARVRYAMSELFMPIQEQELSMLQRVEEQWIEIALGETQEPVHMQTKSESAQVMVIHMKFLRLPAKGAELQMFRVVLPTVVLPGTATADILGGLFARLPLALEQLKAVAERTTFLLNTDSFGSCLKLVKCLRANHACLSCPCRMHQLCISMTASIAQSGLMASLFCGALLLRRSRLQKTLRARLERYVAEKLRIEYDPPSPPAVSHARAVWDLLWPLIELRHDKKRRLATARAQAWRRLRKNLCGPLDDKTCLVHYCPYGCHHSRDEAVKEICEDLCLVFLDSPPVVPALNKWTKLTPPVIWFSTFMQVHGLLAHCLQPVLEANMSQRAQDENEEQLEQEQDEQACGFDNFEKEEFARFRKFARFASCPQVGPKLAATLLSLLPGLSIMGDFFASADDCADPGRGRAASTLSFTQPSQSPAVSTIKVLLSALSSEQSSHWLSLCVPGSAGWEAKGFQCAATLAWVQVGQLYARLVMPFNAWPFKAGRMLEEGVSRQTQEALAQELLLG